MADQVLFPEASRSHPAFSVRRVLDHGFVRLVDAMPSPTDPEGLTADEAIIQAARVSYGKGTKAINEDRGLIDYLMRHWHSTPFEMVEMKFHVRMPIFVARQWIRHRTANVNEYSARYSIVPDLAYIPEAKNVKQQSSTNKQGRGVDLTPEEQSAFVDRVLNMSDEAYAAYEEACNKGVARELARMMLPVNYYTEWYWKCDLHNIFNFLRLRADPHAQLEIRVYAFEMLEIVRQLAPNATASFENHRLRAVALAGDEIDVLSAAIGDMGMRAAFAQHLSVLLSSQQMPSGRQREFWAKLDKLGLKKPE